MWRESKKAGRKEECCSDTITKLHSIKASIHTSESQGNRLRSESRMYWVPFLTVASYEIWLFGVLPFSHLNQQLSHPPWLLSFNVWTSQTSFISTTLPHFVIFVVIWAEKILVFVRNSSQTYSCRPPAYIFLSFFLAFFLLFPLYFFLSFLLFSLRVKHSSAPCFLASF